MPIPNDPEIRLTRKAAAAALTEAGYPVSSESLATYASRGGGPVFRRWGRFPTYRWGDLLEWAEGRLSRPMRSTSEVDAPAPRSRRRPRTGGAVPESAPARAAMPEEGR